VFVKKKNKDLSPVSVAEKTFGKASNLFFATAALSFLGRAKSQDRGASLPCGAALNDAPLT
jgi:hypothetical protein